VFQYNKRDLPNAEAVHAMTAYLQPGNAPVIEAAALNGIGVTATLRAAVARILENLKANVDTAIHEQPELAAPDLRAKSGASAVSAGSPNGEPFAAVAVAEPKVARSGRGEVEALLDSARQLIASLEAALQRAREHERALRERLSRL
jgi:hypothetical protein